MEATKRLPLAATLMALGALALTPANRALQAPIALASFPSSSAPSIAVLGRSPSTIILRAQSSSAAAGGAATESASTPKVGSDRGRPSPLGDARNVDDDRTASGGDSRASSILRRIFDGDGGGGGVGVAIRGDRYGSSNNSTILMPSDAAIAVGVEPTLEASKETWQRAWRAHRFMMKLLHRFDGCRPKDSKLALACLWWKALAGNDPTSPVHDRRLSYDLLPPITRWIVHRRLCRWYPRLHHANVEIRTAYLDKSVSNVINSIMTNDETCIGPLAPRAKIRLIVMGGGYDTRSMKLLERSLFQSNETASRRRRRWWRMLRRKNDQTPSNAFQNITSDGYDLECYELDLPEVVRAKRQLLQSRLFRRRPWLREAENYPTLIPADFNDANETRRALEGILRPDGEGGCANNIILFEGVMIYLDEGVPHSLLRLCSNVLRESDASSGHLCFADRLENIPGGDEDAARAEMEGTGWELLDWLPKPGLARHMGVARLKG